MPRMKKVTLRVERFDGRQARTDEFEVKYDNTTTVLQALESVKGEQDGTLTFRRSCRASICGSCGMTINNRARLACKTKVHEIVDGDTERGRPAAAVIDISPQKNQPVLKDLAVDLKPFYDKVDAIKPYVQDGQESAESVDKTSFEQVNMVSNCIMCGCCYADCTEIVEKPSFLGPAALAKAFRFVSDPREGHKTERLQELSEENGIWDCTRCGMCVDACPKDVAPMEAIAKLRTRAIAAGVTDNPGARHAIAFKADIENIGMVNEATLLVKTVGLAGAFKYTGNALHLAKKGKIPHLFPEAIEDVNEIRDIYQALEENPIEVETKQEDTGPAAG